MYEAVHAHPDGESDLDSMVTTAASYGFAGIVVRNHGDARLAAPHGNSGDRYGIDVVEGVEIRAANPSEAGGYLGMHRPETTVVLVHGGTPAMNRFAVETEAVDVLAHPQAGSESIDHVIVERAAAHSVSVEVDLSPVLRSSGGTRVRAINRLRRLKSLLEHAGAPFVVSADSHSLYQLRTPRELIAVGKTIGFDRAEIEQGLTRWQTIATQNRQRLSDAQVAPGVRRVGNTEGDGST